MKLEDFLDHGKYWAITIAIGCLLFMGIIALITILQNRVDFSGDCIIQYHPSGEFEYAIKEDGDHFIEEAWSKYGWWEIR